jgi:hypothetical protein
MGASLSGTAELGYWIGKPYRGQGLATQAGHLVLIYAFQTPDLHLSRPSVCNAIRPPHGSWKNLAFA